MTQQKPKIIQNRKYILFPLVDSASSTPQIGMRNGYVGRSSFWMNILEEKLAPFKKKKKKWIQIFNLLNLNESIQ